MRTRISLLNTRVFALLALGVILTASGVSAGTTIWNGPVTTNTANNWSASGNWTTSGGSTPPGLNDDVKFFDAGAIPGVSNINNTVDASLFIGSLQYGNTNNNHTTLINSGVTLSVTNANGLFVGTPTTASPSTQVVNATVTGAGALVVSNRTAFLVINQGAVTAATTERSTLDLTGLNTFSNTVKSIFIGSTGNNVTGGLVPTANGAGVSGTLLLAKTNVITVVFAPASSNYPTNVMATSPGINIGYNGAGSAGGVSYLYLGQNNTINVDSISVGQTKGVASMLFGSAFTNNNPLAVFRGINGGTTRVSYWVVGDEGTRGGSGQGIGTNDFTFGTLDAMVSLMNLGQDTWIGSGAAADTGTTGSSGVFTFPSGVLDVNTLTLGSILSTNTANKSPSFGIMNVGTNATLKVNTVLQMTFTMTNNQAATNSFGKLNVTNGTVLANSITVGTYAPSASISINLSSATLIVSNVLASSALPLTNYYTANSRLGLTVTANSATKAFVGTLTTGGATNVIQLDATPVFFGSYPAQIALIKYSSLAGSGYNFGLTNVPGWAPGASLLNNTANKSIDLVLPSDPRPSTTAPASYSGSPGDNVIFSVTAGGVTPLSYQWRKDGVNIFDGATGNGSINFGTLTAALSITNAQPADSANTSGYTVIITNLYGSITSSPAVLAISASAVAPVITGPANITVIQGNNGTFSASVSGSPVPDLRWLDQTGAFIGGATSSSLTLNNVQYSQNGFVYSIVASNSVSSVTNSATLTVIVPPSITLQPTNVVVTNTQAASFIVVATGVPAPWYQWNKNGTPISSSVNNTATNATFTIASVSASDMATYSVTITNLAGTTNSVSVTLTVNSLIGVVTLSPTNSATGICYDTPLAITFSAVPSLGANATIKIYNITNSTTPVDSISVTNGVQARTFPGDAQAFAYQTIQISGNTVKIFPHFGVMSSNAIYYVTIDNGAFTDPSGANFAGITATNAWKFSTKGGPVDTNNPVVNADGSADFVTVQGALNSLATGTNATPRIVSIRNGLYNEIVDITGKHNITLRGQSRIGSVISFPNNLTFQNPVNGGTTHARMNFKVNANDIAFDSLTISNSTPQGGSQAEALMIESSAKRCIINNSDIVSRQDTILGNQNSSQAYFYKSSVRGNFDYIWGGANFYFDKCTIQTIAGTGSGQLTAARTDTSATTSANFPWLNPFGTYTANGMSFVNCSFTSDPGLGSITLAGSNGTSNNLVSWYGCDFATNYVAPSASLFNGSYLFWQSANTTNGVPVTFPVLTTISGADARLLAATNIPTWFYGWSPQLAPNILTNPVSQAVNSGSPATFTVVATGIPDPTYQWQTNGVNISGATSSTLTIPTATSADAGSYTVIVTTSAGTATSSSATLTVNAPSNTAPTFTAPPSGTNAIINVGVSLAIGCTATDSDTPAQTLTYALRTGPSGAAVNSSSGNFTWRPTVAQAGSVNTVKVSVTDNGTPNLSTTNTFTVTVNALTQPTATTPNYSTGQFTVGVSGQVGPDYALQATTNLAGGTWTTVASTNSPATMPVILTDTNAGTKPMQFYRVVTGPPLP